VPRRLRWPSHTHDDLPRPPIKSVEEQQRCKSRQSSHQRSPALSSPWLLRRCPSRGPCCLPRMSYSRGQSFPLKTCCHRRMSFQPGIFFLPRIFSQRGHSWPLKTYAPLGLCCRSTGSTSMTLAYRRRRECLGQFISRSLPDGASHPSHSHLFLMVLSRLSVVLAFGPGYRHAKSWHLHWEQMESSPRTSVTWRMRALVKSVATLRPPPRGWVFLSRPHRSNLLSLLPVACLSWSLSLPIDSASLRPFVLSDWQLLEPSAEPACDLLPRSAALLPCRHCCCCEGRLPTACGRRAARLALDGMQCLL
jgi:hypothetical protein